MAFDYMAALQAGKTKEEILDYLSKSRNFDVNALKKGGMTDERIMERLSEKVKQERQPTIEEDLSTKGWLGKVGSFLGVEKLGRRVGYEIGSRMAGVGEMQKSGVISEEDAKRLRTGDVTNKQALASAAQTALSVALPFAGKAVSSANIGTRAFGGLAGTGVKMLKGAALGGTFGGLGATQNEQDVKSGIVGGAVVGAALPLAVDFGKYALSRVPKLLGIATGEKVETINAALKNPQIADQGVQQGDDALRSVVKEGSKKSVQMRNEFVKSYSKSFDKIVSSNKSITSKGALTNEFKEMLADQGVVFRKGGVMDFTTSKIKANPGEVTKIKDAYQAIRGWHDFTPKGVNSLKQLVGDFTRFPAEAGGVSKSPTLGMFYHSLDETIKNGLPAGKQAAYEQLNTKFSNNIDLFNDMVDAFNSGDPFSKLANALGNNKDTLRQVLKFYEKQGGKDVTALVAGRELAAEKTSGGLLGTGLGFRNFLDFLWSPESQAKTTLGIGRFGQTAGRVGQNILGRQIPGNLGTVGPEIGKAVRQSYYTNIGKQSY